MQLTAAHLRYLLAIYEVSRTHLDISSRSIAEKLGVTKPSVVRILNPADYMEAMATGIPVKDKKKYLAEYGKYVSESIVYDKEYRIIFSIMRDITEEETRTAERAKITERTVDITNEVIEKQMRVVQEIASLLGETTAETKVALTKLKDALKEE